MKQFDHGFTLEDFKKVPHETLGVMGTKNKDVISRYYNCVDMMAAAIYQSHFLAAVAYTNSGDINKARDMINAMDPEPLVKMAETYADELTIKQFKEAKEFFDSLKAVYVEPNKK